ncbi:MAG: GDP-mannose 4,6-dehydratase [Synergistetes bacterium]|nr:GDP-mannose 4,6-dehydratase [Synergistota bacterium]MCX8127286.1 GDP-mannose 4,6-dehydratase [Synergistota bacterium]MDW8191828.1 GDP-mannose 4,6-dehydratase [Synergistota bacterium]
MILVTGCAGFIGSKVAERLLESGEEVFGVDDLNDSYDVRLKEWRLNRLLDRKGFSFKRLDISDEEEVLSLFKNKDFSAVINLAARAGVRRSLKDPWVYLKTNELGNLNILEGSRAFGVRKVVIASTSSVYGLNELPFSESAKADTPLSPYAASKRGAECWAFSYHYLYNLDITILRYFTVYGPAGRPDMSIFKFIRLIYEGKEIVIYGDGNQERDFTYVDDIAEGTIKALKLEGFHRINLGSDRPVRLNYVIKLIEESLGKEAKKRFLPPHPADVPKTWADITLARQILNWSPKIPIEEGIKRTIRWFQENLDLALSIDLAD